MLKVPCSLDSMWDVAGLSDKSCYLSATVLILLYNAMNKKLTNQWLYCTLGDWHPH